MNGLAVAMRWAGGAALACALSAAVAIQGCGDTFTSGSTSATGGAAGSSAATTTSGSGATGGTGQGGTAGTGGGGDDDAGVVDSGPPPDASTDAGTCDTCADWYATCIEEPNGSICDTTNLCPGSHTLTSALATCMCSGCPVACPFSPCPGMSPTATCRECLKERAADFCPADHAACLADAPPTD